MSYSLMNCNPQIQQNDISLDYKIIKEREQLRKSVETIAMLNRNQHDLQVCACEECIYGRQLNRRSPIGLELSKSSIYRQSFDKRHSYSNEYSPQINYERLSSVNRTKPGSVQISTMYGADYSPAYATEKVIKPHPQDQLKFLGPQQSSSSYKNQYLEFRGNANPYVKHHQVSVDRTLKLNGSSTYQQSYVSTNPKQGETSAKGADHFHHGLPWTGTSTYKSLYAQPTPTIIEQKTTHTPSLCTPVASSFGGHYDTTYKNGYVQDIKTRCPRKSVIGSNGTRILQALNTIIF